MISLKREEKRQYSSPEALVEVSYQIPDAGEGETVINNQWPDTRIFKKFVTDVRSPDIEGWENGIKAEDVEKTRGTLSLIHAVAVDIVQSLRGNFVRKNS
jgi:hypothetical protein